MWGMLIVVFFKKYVFLAICMLNNMEVEQYYLFGVTYYVEFLLVGILIIYLVLSYLIAVIYNKYYSCFKKQYCHEG